MKKYDSINRLHRVMAGAAVDAVPIVLDFESSYACEYAGVDFLKATWHYEDLVAAYDKILQDFDMDISLGLEWRSPLKSELLGSRAWIQNRDNGTMQHPEVTAMEAEDYPLLIQDPHRCFAERILPRLYSKLGQSQAADAEVLLKAMAFDNSQLNAFYTALYEVTEKHQVPSYHGSMFYAPFDLIADHLRGITQISLDLRRHKNELLDACAALTDIMVRYVDDTLYPEVPGFPFAASWVHLPPMINPKQFKTFFWPTFKKVCDALVDHGHYLYLQFQGDYTDGRYFDYYSELAEGKALIAVEHQDFKQTLETIGKHNAVSCSYPLSYLTTHSEQACIDKAKEILDIGMAHGRFYFGFNKPAFSFKDAAPEKMKAVINFVREYGKY